jgi:hypothetical protein
MILARRTLHVYEISVMDDECVALPRTMEETFEESKMYDNRTTGRKILRDITPSAFPSAATACT